MAVLVCPRCSHANPSVAIYCHYDGVVLQQNHTGAVSIPGQLPQQFVFPSNRTCRTMDELVKGLHDEWDDACELLRKGRIRQYFHAIGRGDLADAASEAERQGDIDIGLHNFLTNLPTQSVQKPRLDLTPRRLNLDTIRPGEVRDVPLKIFNLGQGLLQGKLRIVEGGDWLQIRGATGNSSGNNAQYQLIKSKKQTVELRIDTRGLPAPHSYNARIHVITNGGVTEVPIRLDLGAIPFPHAPFKGARTQREIAEKMVKKAKAAVPFFENGEIQRWFAANGWSYPIQGTPARGIAAVQQFFEAMGLSKPPTCKLSQTEVQCLCVPPEIGEYEVTLKTSSKKWVYAQVDSDVHWLRAVTPDVSGAQKSKIIFEVDSSLLDPGMHEGFLHIVANGGQQLQLRVVVEVQPPHIPFTRRLLKPFFSIGLIFLLYRLLFVGPGDVLARLMMSEAANRGTPTFWMEPAIQEGNDFLRVFTWYTWWIGILIGAVLLWRRRTRATDIFSGIVAGSLAGVVAAVTFASIVNVVDVIPRQVYSTLFATSTISSPVTGTIFWILLALACWLIIGGVAGLVLNYAGRWGKVFLSTISRPFQGVLSSIGLQGIAPVNAGS